MRLSEQDLIKELHQLAEKVERVPTLTDLREHGSHSATTYYDRFGSWQESLQAAGFEPRDPESKIPKEELLSELTRLSAKLNESPSAQQMNTHGKYWASTYKRRFGSWNAAIEEAGLEPQSRLPEQPISEEELLKELKRVAEERDEPPSYQDMETEGKFAPRTYIRHFGSWNAAVEAAGFEPNRNPHNVSEEDLINELHQLADELGRCPSSTDMAEHGKHAVATYQRHFGSWSEAVATAFENKNSE